MKKKYWVGLIVLLVGVSLSACSGKSSQKSEKTSTGEIKQEVSINVPTEINTLDTTLTTDKNTFTMVQHLFEGLYRFDENSQPIPALAEEPATISEDGTKYSFKLRKGAKWSNGEEITAKDFVYAWQLLVNPESGAPNAYLLDNVKNGYDIRTGKKDPSELGIEATSDYTLEVELINPQPSFLTLISIGWLAPKNQKYVEAQGKEYAMDSEHLIYNGPFVLSDWKHGDTTWTLEKNKEYYEQSDVHLDTIKVNVVKDINTGLNLFDSGEVELTNLSGEYVSSRLDDKQLVQNEEIATTYLDYNQNSGNPLANEHLRKAISYSIDQESLVKVLNDGSKPVAGLIPAHLYQNPETGEDFREYSGSLQKFDKKLAQKEWEEAKKELGNEITVDLLAADDDSAKKVSEYIQSTLTENLDGLKITILNLPRINMLEARKNADYDISITRWIAGDNALSMYFNLYDSESAYNYSKYNNSTYDELTRAAKTTDANDPDKMFTDYKKAEKLLVVDDTAITPLYQASSNYLVADRLQNVVFHLYGDYFNLRDAQVKE